MNMQQSIVKKRAPPKPRDAYMRLLEKNNKQIQSKQAMQARYKPRDPNAAVRPQQQQQQHVANHTRTNKRKRKKKKPGESSSSEDEETLALLGPDYSEPVFCALESMIRTNSPLIVMTSAFAEAETDYENRMHRQMPIEGDGPTLRLHHDTDAVNQAYEALEPRVTLWPYQEEGVQFMAARESDTHCVGSYGGMLCDEMGLGKTLQMLVHVHRDIKRQIRLSGGSRFNGVTLIVVPKIVCPTWTSEIERSFPPATFRYIRMMGEHCATGDALALDASYVEGCCDLIFTTFDVVRLVYEAYNKNAVEPNDENSSCEEADDDDDDTADAKPRNNRGSRYDPDLPHRYRLLFQIKFRRVLIDEAHFAVNRGTRIFAALRALDARSKWMITGTPIQNSYANFLACLELIALPEQWWSNGQRHSTALIDEDTDRDIQQLRSRIMLRRCKADIAGPPLYKVDRQIEFLDFATPQERAIYLLYAEYGRNAIDSAKNSDGSSSTEKHRSRRKRRLSSTQGGVEAEKSMNVTTMIRLMRQCCIDLRVVQRHTLPGGILMAGASSPTVVRTTFNEALFRDNVQPLRHIDPQANRVMEARANDMCEPTLFRYRKRLAMDDDDDESLYMWAPYQMASDEATACQIDLTGNGNGDIQYSRELYSAVYGVLYEWRQRERRDPTLTEVQAVICAELYPDATTVLDGETDEDLIQGIQLVMRQIAVCYEHLMRRVFPLMGTKIRRIIQCIREERDDPSDKVILFSDSVRFLRLALSDMTSVNIGVCMISGGTSGETTDHNERQLARFEHDPACLVLLSSLKVGSVGLNLPHANNVYFASLWWNPQADLQAEFRVQRIGQCKTVHIRYFVLRDTMEEYVLSLANYKQSLARRLIGNHDRTGDPTEDSEFQSRLFDFECTIEHCG